MNKEPIFSPQPRASTLLSWALGSLAGALIFLAVAYHYNRQASAVGAMGEVVDTGIMFFVLIVASLVALFLTATAISVALGRHGLSNHDHAMALPKGSIRSILAIGLLLIFFAMSIFLFISLGDRQPIQPFSTAIEAPSSANLPEGVFSVRIAANEWQLFAADDAAASVDIAKQILTTVATVLVTVIGFYFGSRGSVSADKAQEVVEDAQSPAERGRQAVARCDKAVALAESSLDRIKVAGETLGKAPKPDDNHLRKGALESELEAHKKRIEKGSALLKDVRAASARAKEAGQAATSEPAREKAAALATEAEKALGAAFAGADSLRQLAKSAEAAVHRIAGSSSDAG